MGVNYRMNKNDQAKSISKRLSNLAKKQNTHSLDYEILSGRFCGFCFKVKIHPLALHSESILKIFLTLFHPKGSPTGSTLWPVLLKYPNYNPKS